MLTFEHVRKNYDSKRVLEDCSISFEPGKVYALVGPNGTRSEEHTSELQSP